MAKIIDVEERDIDFIFNRTRPYSLDVYQRDYRWADTNEYKIVTQLLKDIELRFNNNYDHNKKNTEETQTQNDTEKPSIELFGDATININVGDSYNELGAVAMDNVDGDITNKIK